MRRLLFEIAWHKWEELEKLGHQIFTVDAEFEHPKLGRVRVHQPAPAIWAHDECPGEMLVELIDQEKLARLAETESLPLRERVDALNVEFSGY